MMVNVEIGKGIGANLCSFPTILILILYYINTVLWELNTKTELRIFPHVPSVRLKSGI